MRLIICRALGPRGHVASGFWGDMSLCRLSTWPVSCDRQFPSLCQEQAAEPPGADPGRGLSSVVGRPVVRSQGDLGSSSGSAPTG